LHPFSQSTPLIAHIQEKSAILEESSTPTHSEIKSTPENYGEHRPIKDRSSELKPYVEKEEEDE